MTEFSTAYRKIIRLKFLSFSLDKVWCRLLAALVSCSRPLRAAKMTSVLYYKTQDDERSLGEMIGVSTDSDSA